MSRQGTGTSGRHVHLVGIGGIGLSAIARILMARGDRVSGSDLRASLLTDELAELGAQIQIGHRAENVDQADLVLVTSAAPVSNPEIVEAQRRGIRIVKRSDFFPELTAGKKVIAVAGTHGKTTTTGMIATILVNAGLDPTAVIGGLIPELGGNALAGSGEYFVVEADEYDRAFLGLAPAIAVVTSIEMDHPDIYPDVQAVTDAFREFMALTAHDGLIIGCGDSERIAGELNRVAGTRTLAYGFDEMNDWRAGNIRTNTLGGNDFTVWHSRSEIGNFELRIPGRHNVLNALAALAVAERAGVTFESARRTLAGFRGAARRFEVKGEYQGTVIVDDYAHHPTEIRATLAAARARYPGKKIWAVFQPHTFSRTRALLDDFAGAFDDADHVRVTEIFAAREQDSMGMGGVQIVERMHHADARFVATLDECIDQLKGKLGPGDVLITLGAGDVYRVGVQVALGMQGERNG